MAAARTTWAAKQTMIILDYDYGSENWTSIHSFISIQTNSQGRARYRRAPINKHISNKGNKKMLSGEGHGINYCRQDIPVDAEISEWKFRGET